MFRGLIKCRVRKCTTIRDSFLRCCKSTSSIAGAPLKYDVVIIGAGCIGSLIAFWLKKKARELSILVIDRDLTYRSASTVVSCGGIRQQFTVKENIQLSYFTAEFVQNIEKYVGKPIDVHFKPYGYLMLRAHGNAELAKENYEALLNYGGEHELLSPSEVKIRFPWLNTDGIGSACLGIKNEGWLDPWTYLTSMKDVAKNLGVCFLEASPCKFNYRKSRRTATELDTNNQIDGITTDKEEHVLTDVVIQTSTGKMKKVEFKNCVIATGCETGKFAQEYLDIDKCNSGDLRFEIPIERRKRYIFSIECRNNDVADGSPLLVDTAGFMFRKESSSSFITGNSPPEKEEPSTDNLDVDYEYFDQNIWPDLAKRMPCFEAMKVISGWAGFYDYNYFDKNGIVGPHPAYKNMIIAAGFSGHGLQHSAAVGRGVAEFLLHGKYQTIDLSPFSFQRVIKNEPLLETAII